MIYPMETHKYWYRWLLQQGEKVCKVSKQSQHFKRDMTSLNFDVTLDYFIIRDGVFSILSQFNLLHRAYLQIKFHDDRIIRTCWTKSLSFQTDVVLEMSLFRRLRCDNSTTQTWLHIKLCRLVDTWLVFNNLWIPFLWNKDMNEWMNKKTINSLENWSYVG